MGQNPGPPASPVDSQGSHRPRQPGILRESGFYQGKHGKLRGFDLDFGLWKIMATSVI